MFVYMYHVEFCLYTLVYYLYHLMKRPFSSNYSFLWPFSFIFEYSSTNIIFLENFYVIFIIKQKYLLWLYFVFSNCWLFLKKILYFLNFQSQSVFTLIFDHSPSTWKTRETYNCMITSIFIICHNTYYDDGVRK